MSKYVHGYSKREAQRLKEQSEILERLLHDGNHFPAGANVLEAGCGVGAQSVILAKQSPEARFTSIDISPESLEKAEAAVHVQGHSHFTFQQADILHLSFEDNHFDFIFVCFVLEHLDDPDSALLELKRVLKSGGEITVIEGDHGSCFWHTETEASLKVWECMIRAQAVHGHDANIGRRIYPLLHKAGFDVHTSEPKWVYGDGVHAQLLDGMVNQIIVPMVQTAKVRSIEAGWVDEATWAQGIRELEASGDPPEGTFFYTWFKAKAVKS
ncbi:methyltransferase domain-containing protein [candidate division KSB1 bacterium]|nr:methyltransferase domain-containing protein [candidate division KSB1 bacterium]